MTRATPLIRSTGDPSPGFRGADSTIGFGRGADLAWKLGVSLPGRRYDTGGGIAATIGGVSDAMGGGRYHRLYDGCVGGAPAGVR